MAWVGQASMHREQEPQRSVCGGVRGGGQRSIDEQLGDQGIGAEVGVDEHGVFGAPAEARELRQGALQQGGGVGQGAVRGLAACLGAHEGGELLQAFSEHVVVVIAARVASDAKAGGGRRIRQGGHRRSAR